MSFFTTNGQVIAPGDSGNTTNYYFVKFTDPNPPIANNITFFQPTQVSYLAVGGGGGGGGGTIYTETDGITGNKRSTSSGGGGGASGQLLTGNIDIAANTQITINIGSGGLGGDVGTPPYTGSGGNGVSTSFNGISSAAAGGQGGGGGMYDPTFTQPIVGGSGGISSDGNGGNGAAEYTYTPASGSIASTTVLSTSATNYNTNFSSYTMNGYNLGTFGGGGGGGGATGATILAPSSSQGSGGNGGSDSISAVSGINGGGGGGGFGQYVSIGGWIGGNGGNGVVIFSFLAPINTGFIVNGVGDLSSIIAPIDWIQSSAPSIPWLFISSNSSGEYLFAGSDRSVIYYSHDYGKTWTAGTLVGGGSLPAGPWITTCDNTGQYVAAALGSFSANIYLSSDYGVTWSMSSITSPSNEIWAAIKINGIRTYLFAAIYNGPIYISQDFGTTWTQTSAPSDKKWSSIACDTTGQYVTAVEGGGGTILGHIYASSDYGATWNQTSAPTNDWISITSDNTGKYLAAAVINGGIYTSNNYGTTWVQTSAPNASWISITSDSTGQYLAVVSPDYPLYKSTDYGSTWFFQGYTKNFECIASSADGLSLTSVTYNAGTDGNIFILNQVKKTGFIANSNNDLNQLFQPLTVNPESSYTETKFKINNYTPLWTNVAGTYDLGQIFVNNAFPYIVTGNPSMTSDSNYNTILTFEENGSIIFLQDVGSVNFTIVGGGAGGNAGILSTESTTGGKGGNGGGGGLVNSITINNYTINASYIITIGNGGSGGNGSIAATNGGQTTFATTTVGGFMSASVSGGIISYGGAGGNGGVSFPPKNATAGGDGAAGSLGYGGDGGGGGGGGINGLGNPAPGGIGGGSSGGNGGSGSGDSPGVGFNGSPGQTYGGGGGGGGGNATGYYASVSSGGNGSNGVVILAFNV